MENIGETSPGSGSPEGPVRAAVPLMVRLEVDGIELTYSDGILAGLDGWTSDAI